MGWWRFEKGWSASNTPFALLVTIAIFIVLVVLAFALHLF